MAQLMQAHEQWKNRPAEERFTSLSSMLESMQALRTRSRAAVVSSRRLTVEPIMEAGRPNLSSLVLRGPEGGMVDMTHHAFGQLATLAGSPAAYLRKLPAPLAADCLNYGLAYERDAQDTGILLSRTDTGPVLRAATGPNYGRIWNHQVIDALIQQFGDGTGHFRVPVEFGYRPGQARPEVTKANTTLYASDRDMWVFLADEERRIEMPNRRDGRPGSLARGFFVWNSEVGDATLGVMGFLFDFMCGNHIVWDAQEIKEVRIRHTAKAPDRFVEEVTPALENYAQSSDGNIVRALENARAHRLDNLDAFLAQRFGARIGERIKAAHLADEGRPMETAWDVVTGATAYAREMPYQADRLEIQTEAGRILQSA